MLSYIIDSLFIYLSQLVGIGISGASTGFCQPCFYTLSSLCYFLKNHQKLPFLFIPTGYILALSHQLEYN